MATIRNARKTGPKKVKPVISKEAKDDELKKVSVVEENSQPITSVKKTKKKKRSKSYIDDKENNFGGK